VALDNARDLDVDEETVVFLSLLKHWRTLDLSIDKEENKAFLLFCLFQVYIDHQMKKKNVSFSQN